MKMQEHQTRGKEENMSDITKPEEISSLATVKQSDFCYAFRLTNYLVAYVCNDEVRTSRLNQIL